MAISKSIGKAWFQVLVTLSITLSIFVGVAYLENQYKAVPSLQNASPETLQSEAKKNNEEKCKYQLNIASLICLTSDLKLLSQLQNLAVIYAAILFIWGTFDRKKQLERQAWQLIDGAQGSETSGARRQAIEELYQEGSDITGLDADGADLRGINLSGANLEGASFKNAILEEANFQRANLERANFS
jgi:hypothetical protein